MSIECHVNDAESPVRPKRGQDLGGMVFGELTVLERVPSRGANRGARWRCRCSCGTECECLGTLLQSGRKRHCGGKSHPKKYSTMDISGQRFGMLTALEPTSERDTKGYVIWKCCCDCGEEVQISYNELRYSNLQSCGCKRREHRKKLQTYLTHVDGTSVDILKSSKIPSDNTTGCRGVYLIRGKYVAKIVFQKKAYYLGSYPDYEDAVKARKEAEQLLFEGTAAFYQRWKEKADSDPGWAADNPMQIEVTNESREGLRVVYRPEL